MQDRVKILGVSVDKIRLDRLFNKTLSYMNQESFHSIYFIGMNTVFLAEKEEKFVQFLEQCDYVIAAEPVMEKKVYQEKNPSKSEKKLLAQRYIERLLTKMSKNKLTLYLIGDDLEEIDLLNTYLSDRYYSITCFKSCMEDETKEDAIDFIINDINSVAPDVMLVLMNGMKSMEFIQENRSRMDVKLCLCIGDAKEDLLKNHKVEIETPVWIKQLHLEKWYRFIFQNFNFTRTISKKRLQNRIKKEELEEK